MGVQHISGVSKVRGVSPVGKDVPVIGSSGKISKQDDELVQKVIKNPLRYLPADVHYIPSLRRDFYWKVSDALSALRDPSVKPEAAGRLVALAVKAYSRAYPGRDVPQELNGIASVKTADRVSVINGLLKIVATEQAKPAEKLPERHKGLLFLNRATSIAAVTYGIYRVAVTAVGTGMTGGSFFANLASDPLTIGMVLVMLVAELYNIWRTTLFTGANARVIKRTGGGDGERGSTPSLRTRTGDYRQYGLKTAVLISSFNEPIVNCLDKAGYFAVREAWRYREKKVFHMDDSNDFYYDIGTQAVVRLERRTFGRMQLLKSMGLAQGLSDDQAHSFAEYLGAIMTDADDDDQWRMAIERAGHDIGRKNGLAETVSKNIGKYIVEVFMNRASHPVPGRSFSDELGHVNKQDGADADKDKFTLYGDIREQAQHMMLEGQFTHKMVKETLRYLKATEQEIDMVAEAMYEEMLRVLQVGQLAALGKKMFLDRDDLDQKEREALERYLHQQLGVPEVHVAALVKRVVQYRDELEDGARAIAGEYDPTQSMSDRTLLLGLQNYFEKQPGMQFASGFKDVNLASYFNEKNAIWEKLTDFWLADAPESISRTKGDIVLTFNEKTMQVMAAQRMHGGTGAFFSVVKHKEGYTLLKNDAPVAVIKRREDIAGLAVQGVVVNSDAVNEQKEFEKLFTLVAISRSKRIASSFSARLEEMKLLEVDTARIEELIAGEATYEAAFNEVWNKKKDAIRDVLIDVLQDNEVDINSAPVQKYLDEMMDGDNGIAPLKAESDMIAKEFISWSAHEFNTRRISPARLMAEIISEKKPAADMPDKRAVRKLGDYHEQRFLDDIAVGRLAELITDKTQGWDGVRDARALSEGLRRVAETLFDVASVDLATPVDRDAEMLMLLGRFNDAITTLVAQNVQSTAKRASVRAKIKEIFADDAINMLMSDYVSAKAEAGLQYRAAAGNEKKQKIIFGAFADKVETIKGFRYKLIKSINTYCIGKSSGVIKSLLSEQYKTLGGNILANQLFPRSDNRQAAQKAIDLGKPMPQVVVDAVDSAMQWLEKELIPEIMRHGEVMPNLLSGMMKALDGIYRSRTIGAYRMPAVFTRNTGLDVGALQSEARERFVFEHRSGYLKYKEKAGATNDMWFGISLPSRIRGLMGEAVYKWVRETEHDEFYVPSEIVTDIRQHFVDRDVVPLNVDIEEARPDAIARKMITALVQGRSNAQITEYFCSAWGIQLSDTAEKNMLRIIDELRMRMLLYTAIEHMAAMDRDTLKKTRPVDIIKTVIAERGWETLANKRVRALLKEFVWNRKVKVLDGRYTDDKNDHFENKERCKYRGEPSTWAEQDVYAVSGRARSLAGIGEFMLANRNVPEKDLFCDRGYGSELRAVLAEASLLPVFSASLAKEGTAKERTADILSAMEKAHVRYMDVQGPTLDYSYDVITINDADYRVNHQYSEEVYQYFYERPGTFYAGKRQIARNMHNQKLDRMGYMSNIGADIWFANINKDKSLPENNATFSWGSNVSYSKEDFADHSRFRQYKIPQVYQVNFREWFRSKLHEPGSSYWEKLKKMDIKGLWKADQKKYVGFDEDTRRLKPYDRTISTSSLPVRIRERSGDAEVELRKDGNIYGRISRDVELVKLAASSVISGLSAEEKLLMEDVVGMSVNRENDTDVVTVTIRMSQNDMQRLLESTVVTPEHKDQLTNLFVQSRYGDQGQTELLASMTGRIFADKKRMENCFDKFSAKNAAQKFSADAEKKIAQIDNPDLRRRIKLLYFRSLLSQKPKNFLAKAADYSIGVLGDYAFAFGPYQIITLGTNEDKWRPMEKVLDKNGDPVYDKGTGKPLYKEKVVDESGNVLYMERAQGFEECQSEDMATCPNFHKKEREMYVPVFTAFKKNGPGLDRSAAFMKVLIHAFHERSLALKRKLYAMGNDISKRYSYFIDGIGPTGANPDDQSKFSIQIGRWAAGNAARLVELGRKMMQRALGLAREVLTGDRTLSQQISDIDLTKNAKSLYRESTWYWMGALFNLPLMVAPVAFLMFGVAPMSIIDLNIGALSINGLYLLLTLSTTQFVLCIYNYFKNMEASGYFKGFAKTAKQLFKRMAFDDSIIDSFLKGAKAGGLLRGDPPFLRTPKEGPQYKLDKKFFTLTKSIKVFSAASIVISCILAYFGSPWLLIVAFWNFFTLTKLLVGGTYNRGVDI